MIHTDHVGNSVTHRVHRVVRLVTMISPVARVVGDKIDVTRRADRHLDGRLAPAPFRRDASGIGAADLEMMPVQMHRVLDHAEVADPDADALAGLHDHRMCPGIDAAV